jgi:hypothetical protein
MNRYDCRKRSIHSPTVEHVAGMIAIGRIRMNDCNSRQVRFWRVTEADNVWEDNRGDSTLVFYRL